MKVAVISSAFPFGRREPYLGAELAALRPHVADLAIAPLRPFGRQTEPLAGSALVLERPWSRRALLHAACAWRRAPRACLEALVEIVTTPRRLRVKLKNLWIFPQALALAERMAQHGIEHVHAYWLSAPATAALVVSRVNGIPWSSSAHRWDIFEDNMIARKADSARFVRAISEHGRTALAVRAPHAKEKISVVRLGTALRHAAATRSERRTVRLLCAAAFVKIKGHWDLVQAFERAYAHDGSLELTLAGCGPLEAPLRTYVSTLRCSGAIAFRGYLRHDVLLGEITAGHYDAVVLASRDDGRNMEGVPAILIEAASAGVACVATTSGSVCELLDESSAFLARPGDVAGLAQAILAATEPAERSARAQRAFERTRRLHDPERTALQIARLLAAGGVA